MPDLVDSLTAPNDLTPEAEALWNKMAPHLQACGLLTVADVPTFARYCRTYAAWDEAMTIVETEPNRDNVLTLAKLDEMLRKLEANLGLSPADRTGIRTEKPSQNGKAKFFAA